MNKAKFLNLLNRYIKNNTSLREDQILNEYYNHLQDAYSVNTEDNPMYDELEEKILARINKRLDTLSRMNLLYRIAGVMSVVIVLGMCGYFYYNHAKSSTTLSESKEQEVIIPGGNKATLTLSDGSQVSLSDAAMGRIADQANTTIEKTADGQLAYKPLQARATIPRPGDGRNVLYNTISTPRGGQYQILLSDGTKVWLNAASSLKYPTHFDGKERKVELRGEGYFEVSDNKAQPFKVISVSRNGNIVNEQEVTVFGTHFNINAYNDEATISTTLLTGLVDVSPKRASGTLSLESSDAHWVRGVTLKAGEQSFVTNSKVNVAKSDQQQIETAVAWKNGLFKFNRADLATVMQQLSKWYDLEVIYQGKIPKREFTGKIYRTVSFTEALDILKYIKVKFRMEGRKIIIMS